MDRRVALRGLLTMPLMTAVLVAAHPGHEYHAEGSVTKTRGQVFEVEDNGGKVTFAVVALAVIARTRGHTGCEPWGDRAH